MMECARMEDRTVCVRNIGESVRAGEDRRR
jgi:hypothetical protein